MVYRVKVYRTDPSGMSKGTLVGHRFRSKGDAIETIRLIRKTNTDKQNKMLAYSVYREEPKTRGI